MTERLSDDRLRELTEDDVSAITMPWPEAQAMASELLALRGRIADLEKIDSEAATHVESSVIPVRPGSEWREDMGPVLWLQFFDGETPLVYAGTPTDRRYTFYCSIVVFAKLPSDDEVRAADARERAIWNALPE